MGKNFKFHSQLKIDKFALKKFPSYYQEIFVRWAKSFNSTVTVPSTIVSQCLWYNKEIQVDNKSIYVSKISEKNINFWGQIFDNEGKIGKKIKRRV